jgi:ferrous iron transport protein B
MIIEIIITLLIVAVAAHIIYKNIKDKAQGKCECTSSCSHHCKNYKEPKNSHKKPENK